MQMRLHPAESRVLKLSKEIPAEFIAFDVLLWKGKPLHELPLEEAAGAAGEAREGLPALALHVRSRRPRASGSTRSRLPASTA